MTRALMLLTLLLAATPALGDPSGRRWKMEACTGSCQLASTKCSFGWCVPQFRIATSIGNTGGMTVNGGLPYADIVLSTTLAFTQWRVMNCGDGQPAWWIAERGDDFGSPQGTAAVKNNDLNNNVIWQTTGNWIHGSNELGLTTTSYYVNSPWLIDADLEMNNSFAWGEDEANKFDPLTVLLHEAGHFAGLNHTANGSAVMFATTNIGQKKHDLTVHDISDICTVYPAGEGGTGGGGGGDGGAGGGTGGGAPFGSGCTANAQCASGVCRSSAGSSDMLCTTTCTTSTSCPTGFTCQNANTGLACLPQVGAPDYGKFCLTGAQCNTNICERLPSGQTFCSSACAGTPDCPANSTCNAAGRCQPNSGTVTGQCTPAGNECGAGYTCTGGACIFNGNPGNDCTAAGVCTGTAVCAPTGNGNQSFCRTCCSGNGNGGQCTNAPNITCPANQMCVAVTGASPAASVCTPTSPGQCQACGAQSACAEGLVCAGGICRLPCNPQAPGAACQACYTLADGTGACACQGELSGVDGTCGQLSETQLRACSAGLLCVTWDGAATGTCVTQCDYTRADSCGVAGKVCQRVSGFGVCLDGVLGAECTPATSTNSCNTGLSSHAGTCYQTCNTALGGAPCAGRCVQTSPSGTGVCACDFQIAGVGGTCGDTPEIRACAAGSRCVEGRCKTPCVPPGGCASTERCSNLGDGSYYCTYYGSGTGGGGGSSEEPVGGQRPIGGRGGSGGGNSEDLGCGCSAGGGEVALLAFAFTWLSRRRRASPT